MTTMQCLACGTTRGTLQTIKWPERRLKCAGCGVVTEHRTSSPISEDWRESCNGEHSEQLYTLMLLESIYRDLGIGLVKKNPGSDLGPGLFGLAHESRDGRHFWEVQISSQASLDGRIAALRHALRVMVDGEGVGADRGQGAKRERWVWQPMTAGHLLSEQVARQR